MENQEVQQPVVSDDTPAIEGDFYPGKDMFELEKERIKSADKRTEIARLAIEANDSADARMFDYHMSRLEHDTQFKIQQAKVASRLLYGGGVFIFATVGLLLGMSFFGNDHQSQIAANLFEKLITALGGIGLYLLGQGIFGKLNKPNSE